MNGSALREGVRTSLTSTTEKVVASVLTRCQAMGWAPVLVQLTLCPGDVMVIARAGATRKSAVSSCETRNMLMDASVRGLRVGWGWAWLGGKKRKMARTQGGGFKNAPRTHAVGGASLSKRSTNAQTRKPVFAAPPWPSTDNQPNSPERTDGATKKPSDKGLTRRT